jgi:chromosome segregation ATPase
MDERLGGLGERIAGMDERLGGLGERFAGMDERLARLEAACDERLAAIEKRLATADERQGTLAQRVVNCEALLALVEDRFRRNEPLIRLIRPLAKYARKLPWLGIVVACWVRDAALVLPSLEGS